MSDTYRTLGVSSEKEDVHRAIASLDRGEFAGAFCKLVADPCGDENYCAALHADGAGSKASLAYIAFRESGDFSVFYNLAQDSMVMNLDDLLCVGATDGFVLSNTIDRNAHRVDGNCIRAVIEGYAAFIRNMKSFGVNISLAGGETADVGDLAPTLIVNSTLFVRMARRDVVNCAGIRAGDVIVGFASSGQSNYETNYNSGMGSNGLTAARHLLLHHDYAKKYPESYSDTIDPDKVYSGSWHLGDRLPGTPITIGEAILSPTRTYAPIVREILDTDRAAIHGIIHCTGGGQVKCRNFGTGLHFIKDNLFDTPPLFRVIAETGNIGAREMYQVFNMGHRLEMYCSPDKAEALCAVGRRFGVPAKVVGRVEASADRNRVTIVHAGQTFRYD